MRRHHAILLVVALAGCQSGTEASIEPSGRATAASPMSSAPAEVASRSPSTDPDWSVLERLDGAVSEVGPFPSRWPSLSLATATETDLWWPNGNEGGPPAVARIGRATLEITATIELGGGEGVSPPDAWGSALSKDGVWVPLAYQKAVALIDTGTNAVSRRLEVDATPYAVVEDGDDLWIADWENSEVVKIDIPTGKELLRVTGITDPTEIVIGDEGLWVNEHGSVFVVRLDPTTGEELARVVVGGRPGIELGLGSVWVRSDDEKTIARIDPATNSIAATISLPSNPTGIEVAGGAVWVATGPQRGSCERNAYLVRIDPTSNEANGIMDVPCMFALMSHGEELLFGREVGGSKVILRLDAGG